MSKCVACGQEHNDGADICNKCREKQIEDEERLKQSDGFKQLVAFTTIGHLFMKGRK